MTKVGAVYCTYEDAGGFLKESVERIYPCVQKILFLVNTKPWNGDKDDEAAARTFQTILSIPDPDNKVRIESMFWPNEETQRNAGTAFLRREGVEWHLIIDDDEMYNTAELTAGFDQLEKTEHACLLIRHQIYWKNRDTIIDMDPFSLPALIRTDEGLVRFNQARSVMVYGGRTWSDLPQDLVVCHHMSFVRSDTAMWRKISTFSHAGEIPESWYHDKWVAWKDGMENIHPTNPASFRKAVPASTSRFVLSTLGV